MNLSRLSISFFVFCLLIVSEPCLRARAGLPQPQSNDPLVTGRTIEQELAEGEERRYVFSLESGQFVQVVIEQLGIDVIVAIFGQGAEPLIEVDRPNGSQGLEVISFIAPNSGDYSLQIRSYEKTSAPGRYRITPKAPRTAISSDHKRVEAERSVSIAERLRANNTADKLRQAASEFERAQSLWRELDEPYEEAVALYGAGWSYRALGENQTAIVAFKRALDLMRKVGDRYGTAIVQTGVGWSYLYLGDPDQAFESFNQSLQLRRELAHRAGEGLALYGRGWAQAMRGENQEALKSFEQSLLLRQATSDRRGEAVTRIGLGKIYSRLGRYEESRTMLEDASRTLRELKDNGGQADALSHLGWVGVMLKQYPEAKGHFQEALTLSQFAGDRSGEATARFGLALLARHDGDLSEARDQVDRVVKIIESFRSEGDDYRLRASYFAQAQDYYDFYIDLLMRLAAREPGAGHEIEALNLSERARARSLLDLLTRVGAGWSQGSHHAQPLRVEEIQRRLLDEKTVMLEYSLGAERSFLWLVTQTGVESHILPDRAEIETAARRLYDLLTVRNQNHSGAQRRALAARSDARFQIAARELSRTLLGPVAAKLTGKRLLIVPQGALQLMPFAALFLPATAGQRDGGTAGQRDRWMGREKARPSVTLSLRHPVSYVPLIVTNEIVILPSASALAAIRQQAAARKRAERSLIVFADPVFSSADPRLGQLARQHLAQPQDVAKPSGALSPIFRNLSRLSVTSWEAQQIASLAGDSRTLRGFAANLDAVADPALGNYRIIHFATHAVINSRNPDLSAIVLSQVNEDGQPRNGSLLAKDIYHFRLPAELIALSACRTGLGKDMRGEGLLSLTRGFFSAGAARVMVSLWAVEDQATAELMSRFYRRMLGPERMTPAAALRATQEEMWREGRWGAPYYWSGFALQGEWR